MKHTRSLLLAASALALFISACSQPADIQAPTLAPQFGGADDDYGAAVALTTTGQTLVLSEQAGNAYGADGYENGFYENALLKRYDSSGKLVLNKTIATQVCNYNLYNCGSNDLEARSLHTDSKGYSYALLSFTYVVDDSQNIASQSLRLQGRRQRERRQKSLGRCGRSQLRRRPGRQQCRRRGGRQGRQHLRRA